jgi:hypothetical protein
MKIYKKFTSEKLQLQKDSTYEKNHHHGKSKWQKISDFDKMARPHKLNIGNIVWVANDFATMKNPELATKWKVPT